MARNRSHASLNSSSVDTASSPPRTKPEPGSSSTLPHSVDVKMTDERYLSPSRPLLSTAARNTTAESPLEPAAAETAGLDLLGAGAQVLKHAIDDLESYGIDTDIPLPKIVAVGDQSAGKSSLIEGISEIRVPRESGTCTRCPLQIKTSPDERENAVWRCKVSLVKKYDFFSEDDISFIDPDTHLARPFYPWVEKSEATTVEFAEVNDKQKLEHVIRCAQIATLNPRKDPRSFANRDIMDMPIEVEFSPNLIVLSITGPALPSLTFFDLPGLISNAQNAQDRYSLKLIKNLMRLYVKQENTIVLVAIPMDQEIETSTASGLLRKDSVTDRCVGVLTKPDRFTATERAAHWSDVLSGKAYTFGHGYYVTRQPSSREIAAGITHAQAREAELAFFRSEDWVGRFSGFDDRLGTRNLQTSLSEMLASLMFNCLPNIASQIESKRQEINAQLAELPEPPANGLQEAITVLNAFERQLCQMLNDDVGHHNLWYGWLKINGTFRQAIADFKPTVHVATDPQDSADLCEPAVRTPQKGSIKTTPSKRKAANNVINLASDGEQDAITPTPTPSKRSKNLDGAAVASSIRGTPNPVRSMTTARPSVNKKSFKLPEIYNILENHCANGLRGIDRRAIDSMILSTLVDWHEPTMAALEAVEELLRKVLLSTLEETCAKFRTTELYTEMRKVIIDRFLPSHIRRQGETLKTVLALERTKPMTKDRVNFERLESEEHRLLLDARDKQRVKEHFDALADRSARPVADEIRSRGERDEKLKQSLGVDPFKREIEAVARVRGYYLLASSRFVDHVCQLVENDLFQRFKDELREELLDSLHIRDEQCYEYSARLVEDNPQRAAKRMALKAQKARLEQAHLRLEELKQQFGIEGQMRMG